jgi:alpha 1,3-glucosidase
MIKELLRLRYSLLPVWYTAFRETTVSGLPIVRPHYVVFPGDEQGFSIDNQWFVGGSGLLVKPVTQAGVDKIDVYLPEDQVYYDYVNLQTYRGSAKGVNVTVQANLDRTPLLIRGGSIIPTRQRPRRSTPLMKYDPFTLRVALENTGFYAHGELYLDDGETYEYQKGEFVWREFRTERHGKDGLKIYSVDLGATRQPQEAVDTVKFSSYDRNNAFAKTLEDVGIEKIEVLGLAKAPKKVKLAGGQELVFEFNKGAAAADKQTRRASTLIIKAPRVSVAKDWAILVE